MRIPLAPFAIQGTLTVPEGARGLVLLAQASAASRPSRRDQLVLDELAEARIGSGRLDLITRDEGQVDENTRLSWSDIHFLAGRLVIATDWLRSGGETHELPIGYLGAGGNAAVALAAAAARSAIVRAVVSRCGRPDLIEPVLPTVATPTLLIVRGDDEGGVRVNRRALDLVATADKELRVVRRAPGALEEMARLTRDWFAHFLSPPSDPASATAEGLLRPPACRAPAEVSGFSTAGVHSGACDLCARADCESGDR